MHPCVDIDHINRILHAGFGSKHSPLSALPEYAFAADHGVMLFWRIATGAYNVTLCFEPEWTGSYAKQEIRDGFAWMFTKTDALVVIGSIDKTNAACLAMVPHTLGSTLKEDGDAFAYKATVAKWAAAYGIDAAISEMMASGQSAKAERLSKVPR